MPDNELTTVQTDKETREKLRALAANADRSMAAQLRVMVNRDYQRMMSKAPSAQAQASQQ